MNPSSDKQIEEIKKEAKRIIKFAEEAVKCGRNYGWTEER